MITLEEFMKSEKPKRRSKLEPFKNDILTLKSEGYSEASIIRYLSMNGVTVSQRAVNKFVQNLQSKAVKSERQPKKKKRRPIVQGKSLERLIGNRQLMSKLFDKNETLM